MQFVAMKWLHYETNTLVSYYDEIMFENSLMLNQTGNVQLSSMIHILKSLTPNAKNIFLTLVEYVLQADNVKRSKPFPPLLSLSLPFSLYRSLSIPLRPAYYF